MATSSRGEPSYVLTQQALWKRRWSSLSQDLCSLLPFSPSGAWPGVYTQRKAWGVLERGLEVAPGGWPWETLVKKHGDPVEALRK